MKALLLLEEFKNLKLQNIFGEQKLKQEKKYEIEEAIAELKEAIKPKTCDRCKHRVFHSHTDYMRRERIDKCELMKNLRFNGSCDGLVCDKFESKDKK